MKSDGYSLDDKRAPLDATKHESNNLPDILKRWQRRDEEAGRARAEQSFLVPKVEIAGNDYDLSINHYKEMVYREVKQESPQKILSKLMALEAEIMQGMKELEGMLRG